MSADVESAVRAMTKAERVTYLQDRGWYRLSAAGSQCWLAPGWQRITRFRVDPPDHDRGLYSLAAAVRKAIEVERS